MYRAYPIYDYKTGLYLAKEPWLSPSDALHTCLNAQLHRGVITKRAGCSLFGELVHQVRGESIGAAGSTSYSGYLANIPVRAGDGQDRFKFTDGVQVIYDNGDGTLGGDGNGTINYETGYYEITFNSTTSNNVTADYQYKPYLPVMGIYQYYDSEGASTLFAWNTRRVCAYKPTEKRFHDIVEVDLWSGGRKNFFWAENWLTYMFVTNNKDRIKYYDGISFNDLDIVIDDTGSNAVDRCLLIFGYKGHLVLLHTYEQGGHYPQRARWSAAGDWHEWREFYGGGFVDAPSLDWIVAADFLRDDLIVFFERSIWKLAYTGDALLPFRWEKIADTEGAYATFSTFTFSDEIIVLGPTSFISTDGIGVDSIDDNKIPDFALTFSQENYDLCYAAVLDEIREAWITYPEINEDYCNKVLSLNYRDNTWAVYDLSIHCLGYYITEDEGYTWDEVDATWDELDFTWDARERQPGFPITLGGTKDGKILFLNFGSSDDGLPINMQLLTSRLNPFWKEGRRARLGKVEFLVDADADVEITVRFYKDFETSYYKEQSFTCDGSGEKVWKSVFCGEEATSHRLEIINNQVYSVRIHAIVPYFKPGGVIK